MNAEPEVLSVRQVAELLGVHFKTVYDQAGAGAIPHRRVGRRLLFSRAAIMRWLEGKAA